ncbi:predicted protein [Sclerotinia sclerotiorum 1980 UF-70]|uniref:Uncharacterized protein n=1 Tax=Sclerotinia sclerotiorum (strain ATCC 18683 / 1980 / Ss-1) TaxID=665079 RepID=A7F212_SCLS1|nr:predicted protein [Sclerotinia sclerotiorum 1980 UF-70]EDN95754.1 predicted protein [Sclerotinia sclerotiorum 1980 UF-70]
MHPLGGGRDSIFIHLSFVQPRFPKFLTDTEPSNRRDKAIPIDRELHASPFLFAGNAVRSIRYFHLGAARD